MGIHYDGRRRKNRVKKKIWTRILILFLTLLTLFYFIKIFEINTLTKNDFAIILAYNPRMNKEYSYIIDAYEKVLEEEGVIYKTANIYDLLTLDPESLVKSKPVIIFPDDLNQVLPKETEVWAEEYLKHGGNVFVVYNAGIKNLDGSFLEESIFSKMVGVNYITYKTNKDSCFSLGYFKIKDKTSQEFLEIPEGKIIEKYLVGGYAYGIYQYPIAKSEKKTYLKDDEIYSWVVSQDSKEYPGVIIRNYKNGKVMYVNLLLGHLKTYVDDFLLRTFLRVFLFKIVKIPHIMNVPYGKGGS